MPTISKPWISRRQTTARSARLMFENLERRSMLAAQPLITEFMAANDSVLLDGDGNSSDWIEIFNAGDQAMDLQDWFLTDRANELDKWPFPSVSIEPGAYLVVFASGQPVDDYVDSGGSLHTNFNLSAGGEYLALVDGNEVVQEFTPEFPNQFKDVSYGLEMGGSTLIGPQSTLEYLTPRDDSLEPQWRSPGFTHPDLMMGTSSANSTSVGFGIADVNGVPAETLGPNIQERPSVDGANGSIFLLDNMPFTQSGRVTEWSMYSTNRRSITPLLFKQTDNRYEIIGIGRTRASSTSGEQTFDFDLQSGTDMVEGENFYFGFKDGDNTFDNPGVTQWTDNTNDTVRWFGGGHIGDLTVGNELIDGQTFSRSYSLQVSTEKGLAIGNNVQSEMFDTVSTLYVRYPFTLESPGAIGSLSLNIRYDDGFVAYLNGVKVARRNVPQSVSFDSLASNDRPASESQMAEEIDISEFSGSLVSGENILAIHGVNDALDSSDFLVDAQLFSSSLVPQGTTGYFETATPGELNSSAFSGFVADTKFSIDRGFFDSAQSIEITSATPGATIIYTTDGSKPTARNGTFITAPDAETPPTATIRIGATTTVRAMALKSGFRTTNIDTHTYIFVADVARQRGLWSTITNSRTWGPQLEESLLAIPSISITTDGAISQTERGISMEMIFPDGTKGFQVEAGVEKFGGASVSFPKNNMRFSFKEKYGATKLRYDVFGDGGVDEFDQILLRTGSHDTMFWTHPSGRKGTYVRTRWAAERQLEMGQPAPRGRYVHVYINGEYWGQHNLMERPNAAFMASNFGGKKEDYDAVNAGVAVDGNLAAWRRIDDADVAADYELIKQYVDVENYADYMLLQFYAGNDWDWSRNHNWMSATQREGGEGYQFFAWDNDVILRSGVNANTVGFEGPGGYWPIISKFPEFRLMLADRAQKYFFNGGMFTPERVQTQMDALASEIELSIIAETAKWGRNGSYTPDTWLRELDVWRTDYFPFRTQVVIDQMRKAGLLPIIESPTFFVNGSNMFGGDVLFGDSLEMVAGATTTFADTVLITQGDAVQAFVPSDGSLDNLPVGSRWYDESFDTTGWISGTNGVGYEDNVSVFDPLIGTDIQDEWDAKQSTLYTRFTFSLDADFSSDDFDRMALRMKYDDGFVAYLNGQQIASSFAPGNPIWNSRTAGGNNTEPDSLFFEDFDVTGFFDLLHEGDNVLAIHGLNASPGSTDMLILPEFVVGKEEALSSQPIYYTIDGSDPRAEGGRPIGILSEGELELTDSILIKARTLIRGMWSALSETVFTVNSPIRITELMFNPDQGERHEFIELTNTSDRSVRLAGTRFDGTDQGIEFTFDPSEPELAPGEFVVLVRDLEAFATRYDPENIRIAIGEYESSFTALSNSGETLTLLDATGGLIQSLTFDDDWYKETDGDGFSLTVVDTAGNFDDSANWRSSALIDGSPGIANSEALAGDFSGDGAVEESDFRLLVANFGREIGAHRGRGDLNLDGRTDLIDLMGLQSNMGLVVDPSPAAAPLSGSTEAFISTQTDTVPAAIESKLKTTPSIEKSSRDPENTTSIRLDRAERRFRSAHVAVGLEATMVDDVISESATGNHDARRLRSPRMIRAQHESSPWNTDVDDGGLN